jgi:hypothetical protein
MPAAPAHKRFYRSITPMSSLPKPEFKERAQQLRKDILDIDAKVILLKDWAKNNPEAFPEDVDVGEIIANLTITHRHLEDGRMRLGKAIQAYDGGTSVYPK